MNNDLVEAAGGGRSGDLLHAVRRYFLLILTENLAWETLHLPLYGIWRSGSPGSLAVAVLHCTGGDLLIAAASFAAAFFAFGRRRWPARRYRLVAVTAVMVGIGYTAFSEWLNVYVRGTWTYSDFMLLIPWTGIGFSPILQWVVIPSIAFIWARRATIGRIAQSPHAESQAKQESCPNA